MFFCWVCIDIVGLEGKHLKYQKESWNNQQCPLLKDSPICSDSAKHQTTEPREARKATLICFIHIVQRSWNILHLHVVQRICTYISICMYTCYWCPYFWTYLRTRALQIACMFLSVFVVCLFAQPHHQIPTTQAWQAMQRLGEGRFGKSEPFPTGRQTC